MPTPSSPPIEKQPDRDRSLNGEHDLQPTARVNFIANLGGKLNPMRLELVHGDITEQRVDAIVNAANSSLLGGGGVDGAIHRRGGPAVLAECRQVRAAAYPDGLPAGQAVATTAGKLPARWVIHTVGPVYGRGDVETLRSCYRESLRVADDLGAESIAFPLISAGVYGWPADDAIKQAVDVIGAAGNPGLARLVLFSAELHSLAQRLEASG